MNWDAIGAIGEIVGAIAVLISLIYLAIQIRLNTQSVRSASYQSAITSLSQISIEIGSNLQLARLTRIGVTGNWEDLSEDEKYQFTVILTGLFRNFENFYFQHESGFMEDHLWRGMENSMIGYLHRPNVRSWWNERNIIYSSRFTEFLEGHARVEAAESTVFPHAI